MSETDAWERSGAALLTSSVRRRIVDHLTQLPRLDLEGRPTRDSGMTAAELGDVLGLHSTTVRFHLDQLVRGGLVDSHFVKSGGAGRPAKRYRVADGDLSSVQRQDLEGPYQVLAKLLAMALDPEQAEHLSPEEAGQAWSRQRLAELRDRQEQTETPPPADTPGQWVAKVGTVIDLLQEWGYTPDLTFGSRDGEVTLTLRDCPFLDLARSHPAVACGVHRGLLRGALDGVGEPQGKVSLRPFVTETSCHAVLVRQPGPADLGIPQIPRPCADAQATDESHQPTDQESTDE